MARVLENLSARYAQSSAASPNGASSRFFFSVFSFKTVVCHKTHRRFSHFPAVMRRCGAMLLKDYAAL